MTCYYNEATRHRNELRQTLLTLWADVFREAMSTKGSNPLRCKEDEKRAYAFADRFIEEARRRLVDDEMFELTTSAASEEPEMEDKDEVSAVVPEEERTALVQGDPRFRLPKDHPARLDAQKRHGRELVPPGTISWAEHLEAWEAYAKMFGGSQSAEMIHARHGFSYGELLQQLGHPPKTWKPRG